MPLEWAPALDNPNSSRQKMGDLLQPWHLLVLGFVFCCIFLIPAIFYILTLQKALERCAPVARTMTPGMVWLLLVPFFSLIWHFFVVMAIAKSMANEFARRGSPGRSRCPLKTSAWQCAFAPAAASFLFWERLPDWLIWSCGSSTGSRLRSIRGSLAQRSR